MHVAIFKTPVSLPSSGDRLESCGMLRAFGKARPLQRAPAQYDTNAAPSATHFQPHCAPKLRKPTNTNVFALKRCDRHTTAFCEAIPTRLINFATAKKHVQRSMSATLLCVLRRRIAVSQSFIIEHSRHQYRLCHITTLSRSLSFSRRTAACPRGDPLDAFDLLVLASGMRQSEVLGLTRADVRDG